MTRDNVLASHDGVWVGHTRRALLGFVLLIVAWPVTAVAQEWAEFDVTAMVQNRIQMSETSFRAARFDIPSFTVEETGERYFAMRAVVGVMDRARRSVSEVLTETELIPLQDYANWYFAEAASALEVAETPACPVMCVTDLSVNRAYSTISSGNEAIVSVSDFTFQLKVESEPEEARVELHYMSGGQVAFWTYTNDTVPGVDRGRYRIVVQKPGFRGVTEAVNFIDDARNRFVCRLEPDTGDTRSICRLTQD